MNTLAVITESVFRRSGETLSGEIWLDVCAPSCGSELRVALLGTERCTQWAESDDTPIRQVERSVIPAQPACDILLFESDTVLRYGSYIIPFQIDLPKNLPGSFRCARDGYEMCIEYHLQAYVKDDPTLIDKVELNMEQSELFSQRNGIVQFSKKDCGVNQILAFSKAPLHMSTSLEKTVYNRDDSVQVGLKIEYMSKLCKIVKRQLILTQKISVDLSTSEQTVDVNSNRLKPVQPIITDLRIKELSEADVTRSQVELKLRSKQKQMSWGRTESSINSSVIKCQYFISLFVQTDRDQKFYTDPQEIFIRSDPSRSAEFSNHNKLSQLRQLSQYEEAILLDSSLV